MVKRRFIGDGLLFGNFVKLCQGLAQAVGLGVRAGYGS